jgi:hypothetical protein
VRAATAATLVMLAAAAVLLGPGALAREIGADPAHAAALPSLTLLGLAVWVLAAWWMLRGRTVRAGCVVLAGWVAILLGLAVHEGPLGSPRPLAQLLAENRAPGEPIVEYRRFNAGLPFYLREHVLLLEVERELFFTPPGARDTVVIHRGTLAALAARHGRVWILGPGTSPAALADSLGLRFSRTAEWHHQTLGMLEPGPNTSAP